MGVELLFQFFSARHERSIVSGTKFCVVQNNVGRTIIHDVSNHTGSPSWEPDRQ
jgi:hypothetical protein